MTERLIQRDILIGATWLSVCRALAMAVSFATSVAVARHLGADGFGEFLYILTWISLFSSIATAGFGQVAVQEMQRQPSRQTAILGCTFALRLGGGLIGFALATIAAILLGSQLGTHWHLIAIAALALPSVAGDAFEAWLLTKGSAKQVAIVRLLATLTVSALRVVLIFNNAALLGFIWASVAEVVLASTGLYLAYRLHSLKVVMHWQLAEARRLSVHIKPYFLAGLIVAVFFRVDQVMLAHMTDASHLGYYGAAVTLAEAWYFIPTALLAATLPRLAACPPDSAEFRHAILKLLRQISLLGYVIALPLSLLASPLILLLYGPAFASAWLPLAILAWAGLFAMLGIVQQAYLGLIGAARIFPLTVGVACLLNIALNACLIPYFNAAGAALAKLLSYAVSTYLINGWIAELRPFRQLQNTALFHFRSRRNTPGVAS